MIENILGMSTGISLTDLGALAALTSIIVQVLKSFLPKKIPTRIVTLLVAIIISIVASFICFDTSIKSCGIGVVVGFITAFVSMNGFDSLRDIWNRFQPLSIETDDMEESEEAYIDEEDIGGEG